ALAEPRRAQISKRYEIILGSSRLQRTARLLRWLARDCVNEHQAPAPVLAKAVNSKVSAPADAQSRDSQPKPCGVRGLPATGDARPLGRTAPPEDTNARDERLVAGAVLRAATYRVRSRACRPRARRPRPATPLPRARGRRARAARGCAARCRPAGRPAPGSARSRSRGSPVTGAPTG